MDARNTVTRSHRQRHAGELAIAHHFSAHACHPQTLAANKDVWARLPLVEKVTLLQDMQQRLLSDPVSWAMCAAETKGVHNVEVCIALLMNHVFQVSTMPP